MTHLNYYDKTHRAIIRQTAHIISTSIRSTVNADLHSILTTNDFLTIEINDIIIHLQENKRSQKKLASILSQLIDTLCILKKYDCSGSRELQLYIYNSIRNHFHIPSSETFSKN